MRITRDEPTRCLPAVAEIIIPVEETEAYETLLGRAFKRTGKIPPEVLVRHVLAIVPAAEWPVRVEAMDALLRRLDAGREDKLRVESRPPGGPDPRASGPPGGPGRAPARIAPCSSASTRSRRAATAPTSCENSLGVCKHSLTVLEHVHARPRLLAAGDQGAGMGRAAGPRRPVVGPDPAR